MNVTSRPPTWRGLVGALLLMVAAVRPAIAQETINHASVAGRVTDPQGQVIAGATVTARQSDTTVTATATTDESGRFRFPYLRIGPYELTVASVGFEPAQQRLMLNAGSAFEIPVTLRLAGLVESVAVTSELPLIESARSQAATTIPRLEVDNLPLNGRNFLDIAVLAPGVAPPNINSTQLFAETSAVQGVGLSVGSQRNISNNFTVDGLSSNDDAAGLVGMPYGIDTVEQFQVVTSGGQAELGRALSGHVNVITRSGTNSIRGTAYGYFRDDAFNAANALSGTTLAMSQQQYGASLGGPLVKGRTFYFVNAEQRRLDQSGLTTISDASTAVINARLAAAAYPGTPVATGTFDQPIDSVNVLGKVDHAFNGRDQVSVRYSLYDVASANSRGAGGLSAPSASQGLDNRDQAIAFSNTLALGTRTVNETRAQFTDSNLLALPTDPIGPAVNIAGVAAFGTFPSSPQGRLNRMFQITNNTAQQRGTHALRAGIDFVHNDDLIRFPRSERGSYSFASLAAFLAGTYNNAGFSQTFGVMEVQQDNPNLGLYVQDEWSARPGLTLNLGVRYDLQFLDTIDVDTNNLSPRVGVAWVPSPSRTLVVRGSAGLFFDRVPLRALANALLSAGNTTDLAQLQQVNVSLSPGQAGAPAFPAILDAPVPLVTLVNLTTMQRDLQNAYSRQANVEMERQVGRRGALSVGYSYVRGVGLLMAINQNVPACTPSGTNNGCRPIPDYANNSQYSSAGESVYHGLQVSYSQRPSSWGYYRASYTWSKAENNVGEFFFSSPIDPSDLSKDWGRSDNDRRHLLTLSGGLNTSMAPATTPWQVLTHGFQVSGLLQAYSAPPLNITSGVTTIQGTPGRPIVDGDYIPRNSGAGDEFFSVGLRISRAFRVGGNVRLEILAETFNVTNAVNEVTRNTNFGSGTYPTSPSPTYNQVTAVGDPRSWQFAARLGF